MSGQCKGGAYTQRIIFTGKVQYSGEMIELGSKHIRHGNLGSERQILQNSFLRMNPSSDKCVHLGVRNGYYGQNAGKRPRRQEMRGHEDGKNNR